MYTIVITKMMDGSIREKSFNHKKDAISYAHEFCYNHDIENWDGLTGGGIGDDYRIELEF